MPDPFDGFPEGRVRLTPVPGSFFTELLPAIDHLGELKVSAYVFWRLDLLEGAFRYLRRTDFLEDEAFLRGLGADPREAETVLDESRRAAWRVARCSRWRCPWRRGRSGSTSSIPPRAARPSKPSPAGSGVPAGSRASRWS